MHISRTARFKAKKTRPELDTVENTCNSNIGRQDNREFKASVDYTVNVRLARAVTTHLKQQTRENLKPHPPPPLHFIILKTFSSQSSTNILEEKQSGPPYICQYQILAIVISFRKCPVCH